MEFDIILDGKKEFYPNTNTKKYYVLKVDTKKKEDYMRIFFIKFIQNQLNNPSIKHYMGIDYEFNRVRKTERDVALMQINLENDLNEGYIFVLYPPGLSKVNLDTLINLLTTKLIIKILHGAESLDIPYLFNQLLITKENINNFCVNFYDTKYLCDYNFIELNSSGKCSIYYLLVDNKIITQQKKDELEKIEERTGPIYLVHIDINKMPNDILKYSLYDVLYLPDLIKKFILKGPIYAVIIPEISCLVNKYKRQIEMEFNNLEKLISSLNIYFIWENSKPIILKDIWEGYYWVLNDKHKYLEKLIQINYFKYFFEIMTKLMVYYNIIKYFKVYKNKKQTIENINFDVFYKWIQLYPHFNILFMEANQLILNDLKKVENIRL